MPKMGESITEATILKWLKQPGDSIEVDEPILEIATDKVDSEVPSPVAGVMGEQLFKEEDVVEVGKAIAIINQDGDAPAKPSPAVEVEPVQEPVVEAQTEKVQNEVVIPKEETPVTSKTQVIANGQGRFYSPLVLNIARAENIAMDVLKTLPGSGKDGRVTKKDILAFLSNGSGNNLAVSQEAVETTPKTTQTVETNIPVAAGKNVEIVEMDRMRQMIADHMVKSKHTSPHVTSFVEADVTNMVIWRNKHKNEFLKREGEKLTFTPLFIEAVVKALKDFPMVNASVDGKNIIVKKDLNIGMAAALPTGNLIVPVIKNADEKNLLGLAKQVNDLAARARANKLSPDDIDGGTFTLTNVGTFGNLMGTPIINQPQVAILATGTIQKKPVVIESESGDSIGIRYMMFLSLSYDHRIVDGAMGGAFLRKTADYLEAFNQDREI